MAYSTGTLGRAAALAVLAVSIPIEVLAEADRAFPRSERLTMPLGAQGPSNPVLFSIRKVEQEIEQKAFDVSAPPSALDWLTKRRVAPASAVIAAPSLAQQNGPPVLEVAIDVARPPEVSWPRFLDTKTEGRGQPSITLAALGSADLLKSAPVETQRLPWAAAPIVPALLSTPDRRDLPQTRRLEVLPSAPAVMAQRSAKGGVINLPIVAQRYRVSVRSVLAMSNRGAPSWLGGAVAVAPHGTDPLANPEAYLPYAKPRPVGPQFIMPFENGRVTSLYNQGRRHPAIDLAGRLGAPVFATSNGQTVTFAGWRGGYGNAVITRDKEGREHLYGHLSAINTRVGVALAQGDRLGALGSTGFSTGPHVHYEVKDRRGAHINPVTLLFPGRGVSNGYAWSGTGLSRGTTGATAQARIDSRTR